MLKFKTYGMIGLIVVWLAVTGIGAAQVNANKRQSNSLSSALETQRRTMIGMVRERLELPDPTKIPYFARQLHAMAQPDYAEGDSYVGTFSATVAKLTPLLATDSYQSMVETNVLEPLITRDPITLKWQGVLAESWEVSEDGLSYAFNLRKGIRFSNGEPFTAADVVFTFNLIKNPQLNAPRLTGYYEKVIACEVENDYRVVFRLSEPYFLGLGFCGIQVMPESYYGQFSIDEINEKPGLLVGSGPYMLEGDPLDWKPGSGTITLVRNEYYWGPRPALDRLIWHEIGDAVAARIKFRNGELDILGVSATLKDHMSADPGYNRMGKLLEFDDIAGGYTYIGWNEETDGKPTFFADKRVRQAMALLLNRQEMATDLLNGIGSVASGPFHPKNTQANQEIKPWPHDVDRAKKLLADAGLIDRDGDGVLENAAGEKFTFELTYSGRGASMESLVLYMRDAYKQGGIIMTLNNLDWPVLVDRLDSREFSAVMLGWGGSIESDVRQMFHSECLKNGGDNRIAYSNKELDVLIDRARVTLDDRERQRLWHQVHAILHEDQPYTFLFNFRDALFLSHRFKGVEITLVGLNSYAEWYVPREEQRHTSY